MKSPAPISSLEKHVGYWLRFVSNHVSYAFRAKLEGHGVTVAEWVVMRELLRLGASSPSDLADALGVTRGAVSKLVERLVAKKLVDRAWVETDRRRQIVGLTPAGRALVPRLAALADLNDQEFFGHLSEAEKQALISLMRDIAARRGLKSLPLD